MITLKPNWEANLTKAHNEGLYKWSGNERRQYMKSPIKMRIKALHKLIEAGQAKVEG